MADADEVETIWEAFSPVAPSVPPLGTETLAGICSAAPGTVLPAGREGRPSPAAACGAPVALMDTVQAADSSASGTSAVAFFSRPCRVAVIVSPSCAPRCDGCPNEAVRAQVTRESPAAHRDVTDRGTR